MSRKPITSIILLLGASLTYAAPAFAYLDPGTGSIILQGIIATVAGMLVAGRLYWERVKQFFARIVSGNETVGIAETASCTHTNATEIDGSDTER